MRKYCQILGSIYVHLDGCIRDNPCSGGKYCGGNYVLSGTFDECEAHAIGVNADGFSYSSSGGECYMCTNQQLARLKTYYFGGVYMKKGKLTIMIIIYESIGG